MPDTFIFKSAVYVVIKLATKKAEPKDIIDRFIQFQIYENIQPVVKGIDCGQLHYSGLYSIKDANKIKTWLKKQDVKQRY